MSSVFSVGRSSSHTHTHPFTAEACVLKYISLPWVKRRVCSSARCFFGEPAPECIKEQVRRKKNIGMINDSAARHPSIDSLTPINEGQRCLGFIKVATYEILKWARQQHNVELHMTSHQKRKRRREKRKGGRCEEQKKEIALTRGGVREILTSASQKLRQQNSAVSILYSPKTVWRREEGHESDRFTDVRIKSFITFHLICCGFQ